MFSVLVAIAIVIITSSTRACPPQMFLLAKIKFGEFGVIQKALSKRYRNLNLACNKIVMVTSEVIKNLKSFELVDLRNNPLNSSVNFFRRVNTTFLTRSPKAEPSDAKGSYAKSEKKILDMSNFSCFWVLFSQLPRKWPDIFVARGKNS